MYRRLVLVQRGHRGAKRGPVKPEAVTWGEWMYPYALGGGGGTNEPAFTRMYTHVHTKYLFTDLRNFVEEFRKRTLDVGP